MRKSIFKHIAGLILLCGLVAIHSCKNDEFTTPCKLENVEIPFNVPCTLTNNIDTVKTYIEGTWSWLQEERPIRGLQTTKYFTPTTEGYSLELKLQNDTATYFKCGKMDGQYRFAIIKWKDAPGSGTAGFPEGELPVLIFYDLSTGTRVTDVPLIICSNYCILQYQFVSSILGPYTWKKTSN
jgi:hypothetical protein